MDESGALVACGMALLRGAALWLGGGEGRGPGLRAVASPGTQIRPKLRWLPTEKANMGFEIPSCLGRERGGAGFVRLLLGGVVMFLLFVGGALFGGGAM